VPSIMTHGLVGAAAVAVAPCRNRRPALWLLSAGLSMVPDLDVMSYHLDLPRTSIWAHRGISHSLVAALVVGALLAGLTRRGLSLGWPRLALLLSLVMASHGFLDGFTHGGRGIAFFAPFDANRYLFPFRPIPSAPFGLGYFSGRGLHAFEGEVLWVWLPTILVVGVVTLVRLGRRPGETA